MTSADRAVRNAVVYVHGLWMTGLEGSLLRWRLGRLLGMGTHRFWYRSVREPSSTNARLLAKRLNSLRVDTLHLVGHSLGGVLICRMFEQGDGNGLPPGRVVMLGSPLGGSLAARNLSTWKFGRAMLGRMVCEELLSSRTRVWSQSRDLGVIAGTRSVGMGRLAGIRSGISDGTVLVEETRIEGLKEHLLMPVSHFGMHFASEVAVRTARFLRAGSFGGIATQTEP